MPYFAFVSADVVLVMENDEMKSLLFSEGFINFSKSIYNLSRVCYNILAT